MNELFGGTAKDELSAFGATFGAEVDDPIGAFDHIGVVFDDDDGVALFDECVECAQEGAYIVEV